MTRERVSVEAAWLAGILLTSCQAPTRPPTTPGVTGRESAAATATSTTPTVSPGSAHASSEPHDTAGQPAATTPNAEVAVSASASSSAGAPKIESTNEGAATVKLGSAMVRCEANHAAHAGLTSCTLEGAVGKAFVGHGLSDDPSELVCSRGTPTYSWEHGGGWDSGSELVLKPGQAGARIVLAADVEVWFKSDLSSVEIFGNDAVARFEIALDPIPATVRASQIAKSGAGAHADAPVVLDLSRPALPAPKKTKKNQANPDVCVRRL